MKYKHDRNNNWQPNKPRVHVVLAEARFWNNYFDKKYGCSNFVGSDVDIENRAIMRIVKKELGDDFLYIEKILNDEIKNETLTKNGLKELYVKWAMEFSLSEILEDMKLRVEDFEAKYRNLKLNDLINNS